MQGASALDKVLNKFRGRDWSISIVWERVLDSDTDPPIAQVRARVADPRARVYWDPDQRVSKAALPVLAKDETPLVGKASLIHGDVVWDYVAVWKPGRNWEDLFPTPDWHGAPVVQAVRPLESALREFGL